MVVTDALVQVATESLVQVATEPLVQMEETVGEQYALHMGMGGRSF